MGYRVLLVFFRERLRRLVGLDITRQYTPYMRHVPQLEEELRSMSLG